MKILFTHNNNFDKNCYNNATCNEVTAIFIDNDGEPLNERDICIYSKAEGPIRIPTISKHVDPMTYPLLYTYGGFGWQTFY